MFLTEAVRRHPEFRVGLRAMAPQAPGVAAWGLMTGVAMAKSGLSLAESSLMALLVYAGSSQLASLPLIIAGAPAWVVLATGFCVNLRFVVFSLHLRPYLIHLPWWQRLAQGYVTADMSYAIFTHRFTQPATDAEGRAAQEAFLAGNAAINWSSWVGASLLGIALANFIPQHWGLGFAGILCLVGILCSLATTRLRVVSAIVASIAAVVAYSLPLKLNIVMAIAVAVLLCLSLERMPPARGRGKEALE